MSNPGDEISASELVARIRAGDQRAEEALVARFQRGVTLILRKVLGGRAAVDDAFQETFRIAIEKIRRDEIREPEKLPGFMASLARNLGIEQLRREARARTQEEPEDSIQLPGSTPDPLQRLLRSEKSAAIREAIRELPNERDRQILYRFYIAEEEKEDLCREFELSSLHFNRVLHRARQRYKEVYQQRIEGKQATRIGLVR